MAGSTSRIKKTIFSILITFLCFLILELGLASFYAIKNGEFVSPKTLFSTLITDYDSKNPFCRWGDSIKLHPLFLFNYKNMGECAHFRESTNDFGFVSPEFSYDNYKDYYVILFLGGSVNEALFSGDYYQVEIENQLNEKYFSPTGKPFKLVNFSIAGGQQPMQYEIYSYFSSFVNAFVSLEGFNEHYNFKLQAPFGYPPALWEQKITEANQRGFKIAARKLGFAVSKLLQNISFTQYSYLLYSIANFSVPKKAMEQDSGSYEPPFKNFPETWSKEYIEAINIKIYKSYLRAMGNIAKNQGQKHAIFLQPAPAFKESLTENDKRIVGNIDYKETINRMYSELLNLRNEKIQIFDLRSVFDNYDQNLYTDHIHTNEAGNRIIAQSILKLISTNWNLEEKKIENSSNK